MDLLVLDTIHGGDEIAGYLREEGHRVDALDVYRGSPGEREAVASREYDMVISPVHLDPDHPALRRRDTPVISHHEAVRRILAGRVPSPMIEITGTRGKTTTAFALAHLLPGPGVLHTSAGTTREPGHLPLFRKSITPASVVPAALEAAKAGGWLVAEVSLGLIGAGEIGIVTSPLDYRFAAGKKSALEEKLRSAARCRRVVLAPGIRAEIPNGVRAGELTGCAGETCRYRYDGIDGEFSSPLLLAEGYRVPLQCAAAAACLMGIDPGPLGSFPPVPGRLAPVWQGSRLVVDDSNSGVCADTAIEAARFARRLSGNRSVVLVIGQEGRAVCEGFPHEQVAGAITAICPDSVILVGEEAAHCTAGNLSPAYAGTLEEGREVALGRPGEGSVVLAVKTWR